jgi:hypothetical protein
MEPPPGGPEDTVRPFVTGVHPAPGAVNAPRELDASVAFSEWIDKDAARGKVFLSPPPAKKLEVEVDGNVLRVATDALLDSATTYVLGVSGTVKDLHGLPAEGPFRLMFSTGPALDSGVLAGSIALFPGSRPPPGTFAALYPEEPALRARFGHLVRPNGRDERGRADSLPHPHRERPAYLAPADSLGRFLVEGARPGRYRVFAFQDADRDLIPDPSSEPLAVGPAAHVATAEGPEVSLALSGFDTAAMRLTNARWSHERLIAGFSLGTVRLRFSRPVHPIRALRRELYSVRKAGAVGAAGAVEVIDLALHPETGEVELHTSPLRPDSGYVVRLGPVPDVHGNPIDTARDEAPFTAALADTAASAPAAATTPTPGTPAATAPEEAVPIFLSPRRMTGFRDKLPREHVLPSRGLLAYYPRLLTDSVLGELTSRLVVRADTVPVPFFLSRRSHHEFLLKLGPVALKGQALRISFRPPPAPAGDTAARPVAPAPDTAARGATPGAAPAKGAAAQGATWAAFTLADTARLGSLSFRQDSSARGSRLVLRLPAAGLEFIRTTPPRAEFQVDSLPAGLYSVEAFRDADADSIWGPGRLDPWTPQDPFVHYADSVTVEAGKTSPGGPAERPLAFPPSP